VYWRADAVQFTSLHDHFLIITLETLHIPSLRPHSSSSPKSHSPQLLLRTQIMRQRYVASLATVAFLLVLLALFRRHLRDLSEIARTYSGFYPYLADHPEVLYRYHPPDNFASNNTSSLHHQTPKIIHQIYLQESHHHDSTLAAYTPAISSCQTLHPTWTHHLWTTANATTFLKLHYPPLLDPYTAYAQSIQRANILRYALLHHHGGVYLDLDITCLTPLDPLLHLPFLTPAAHPAGVNNAFILAKPGHALLTRVLEGVRERDLRWGLPYVENMLTTGCMFFSNRWMEYARGLAVTRTEGQDGVFVLADGEGGLVKQMLRGKVRTPLFEHGGASSWHGWDAGAIVWVGAHYYACGAVVMGVWMVVAVAWVFAWRAVRRRREGWSLAGQSWEKRCDVERV